MLEPFVLNIEPRGSALRQTWDPDRRLDEWVALGVWRHLAAVALLSAIAVARWHQWLLVSGPLLDESTYLRAFQAFAEGRSPYEVGGYLYTPFFASVGARFLQWQGDQATLGVLRAASVAGLALAVWCSLAWFGTTWRRKIALGALYVALAPTVGAGFALGNLSFAIIGVILLCLLCWSRGSPLAGALPSGLALGATVGAKPLAPLAVVAVFFHRPAPGQRGSPAPRHWLAGFVGGLTALAFVVPMIPQLREMAEQPIHPLSYRRSFSLHRILDLIGVDLDPSTIILGGALLLAILIRLRPLDRSELVAVASTASVMATPIIWNHTLVLTLPLQVMALSLAFDRWSRRDPTAGRSRWYELILVALGALALQLSEGLGAVDEFAPLTQAAFLSFGYLTPAALLVYLLCVGSARRKR